MVCFGAGEEHLVFMNGKGELYGIGNNQYGQLGASGQGHRTTISRVFEDITASKVFCTEFATFIISSTSKIT